MQGAIEPRLLAGYLKQSTTPYKTDEARSVVLQGSMYIELSKQTSSSEVARLGDDAVNKHVDCHIQTNTKKKEEKFSSKKTVLSTPKLTYISSAPHSFKCFESTLKSSARQNPFFCWQYFTKLGLTPFSG